MINVEFSFSRFGALHENVIYFKYWRKAYETLRLEEKREKCTRSQKYEVICFLWTHRIEGIFMVGLPLP